MSAPATLQLPTRRYILGVQLAGEGVKYFKWWMATVILLAALAPLVVAQFGTEIDTSAWFFAVNAAKWFTAFIGGGFLYTLIPILVAQGLTRREVAVSFGIFGLLWSLLLGAVAIAGFIAEHAYYGAFGWLHAVSVNDQTRNLVSFADTLELSASVPLSYLLYFTGGALIGICTYRWEQTGWLVLVPVIPTWLLLDNGMSQTAVFPSWLEPLVRSTEGLGAAAAWIAAVCVIAVAAGIVRRILLDTSIRAKKA